MTAQDKAKVAWFAWKPRMGIYGKILLDLDHCAFAVHNDFGVSFHQCTRKRKIKIGDYAFCATHAKIIKRVLGHDDPT